MDQDRDIVLVTGFGPFGEHKINASWEAVKLLPNHKIDGVDIVVEEIPVIYNFIEERIPLLWEKYKPLLVVHVGVSGLANKLTIETRAFRTGYSKNDCDGKMHPTGAICLENEGENCLHGTIDVSTICDVINRKNEIKACTSENAGRYLCEFTYYKSLHIDKTRTLFVHVPPLNKPYTAEQLAEGLVQVIQCAIQQLCSCKTIQCAIQQLCSCKTNVQK